MKRRRIILIVALLLFLAAETALGSSGEQDANVLAFAALIALLFAI